MFAIVGMGICLYRVVLIVEMGVGQRLAKVDRWHVARSTHVEPVVIRWDCQPHGYPQGSDSVSDRTSDAFTYGSGQYALPE